MGEEAEAAERERELAPYQVTEELMSLAGRRASSCTACRRTAAARSQAEVIDGAQSVVWHQAANRMPTEQALLYALITGDWEG